jgi:2'-5' RNA ligase
MRLFVGLDFPWEIREHLALLCGGVPGARWSPVENFHLTLRFIGEVSSPVAEEIDGALAALRGRAFDLVLAGVGTFAKGGQENTLWVGVERNPALEALQAKVETALQRAGCPAERRRFTPHISLARLRDPAQGKLVAFLQSHNLFRTDPIRIRHFTLFSSRLGKEASVYIPEVEYALDS